jgi:AcrR family transcriptional regulator
MSGKRDRILNVATKLFAAKGFDGTSVRRIAEEAGLSVAGMFHYFSSKEEILFEIMMAFMDEGLKELKSIYESEKSSLERLKEVCKFFSEYFAGHQDGLTILSNEGKSLSPEHKQIFKKKQRQYLEIVRGLLQELHEEGLLKEIDQTVLAFLFFGMVLWTSRWYNPQGIVNPTELGEIISEVFLRGVLKGG